jgi:hypothetical protein
MRLSVRVEFVCVYARERVLCVLLCSCAREGLCECVSVFVSARTSV